jgi:hypothetical protein
VIRFILYLSIHLPDTRSTFQSQRVFFIENHKLTPITASPFRWHQIHIDDLQRLRPDEVKKPHLAPLVKAL